VEHPPRFSRNWGRPSGWLVALLAGSAALRFVGIRYGLPFGNLLNPDEQNIVPRAWRMVHGGGPDPHWFDYPTLTLYVLAPFQAWQAHPSYLAARIVTVALGVGGVGAAFCLGRAAYGQVAGFVAAAVTAVETTHVAYSRMAVTDVPLTLAITVGLVLVVTGRIEWAGLALGVATAAKYPGIFLAVPIVAVGWRRWRRLAEAGVLAVAGFLLGSPYVLVHPLQAWHDAARVQRLARAGWLGFEHDSHAAFVATLWHGVGPALVLACLGLVLALVRRNRADLALASFVLVYFADLLTLNAHFDRYTLPLVPALGVLAGRLRSLTPVTLLLLIVPLTWSIREARTLTRTDARIVAHDWIEAHLPRGSAIAVDPSTPSLEGFRVVALELPGPGRSSDPNRDAARLRSQGVEYVVVNGAVADRVLDAGSRYPRELAFYDALRHGDRLVFTAGPGAPGHPAGPWIAVYHL